MNRRGIAIALIVASTACSSTNREIAVRSVNGEAGAALQDMLARGDLLFSRGENALALDAYRRAMRKDPADVHALNGVAISYAAMGRHDLAREFFELALARAPRDERVYRNFFRSLTAQGLRSQADALMAQFGGVAGVSVVKGRLTLAQLAAGGTLQAPIIAPVKSARTGLERVSMGEVLLRTAGHSATLPGQITSQLSTAIVTVADAGGTTPIISLSRELNAPIARAVRQEAAAVRIAAVPTAPAKVRAISAVDGCFGRGKSARLPATGLSIDLSAGDSYPKGGKCASLARDEGRDRPLRRSRNWSGRLG